MFNVFLTFPPPVPRPQVFGPIVSTDCAHITWAIARVVVKSLNETVRLQSLSKGGLARLQGEVQSLRGGVVGLVAETQ